MKPSLEALRRARRPRRASVDRFIAAHSFPLIDERGATFVWRGEADAVRLRCFVHGLPESMPLERVGAAALWALHVELPRGSRVEYKLDVTRDGHSEWLVDPLNPHVAHDPFGANSVCRAHGYRQPEWTVPLEHAPHGRIDSVSVATPGADVQGSMRVWLPPRYRSTRRYPLLVVHDGGDFLHYAALGAVLERLSHQLEVPEMVVALHEPHDRIAEYSAANEHADLIERVVRPAMERRFALDHRRGLLGASLGAVASLHTAWRYPEQWNRLALMSGSFVFSDLGPHGRSELFDPIVRFVNAFRERPAPLAARWYLSCGRYESLIHPNRAMMSLLAGHGADVLFDEVPDGHHWECWRDRLRQALGWLYPGPVWMVYE